MVGARLESDVESATAGPFGRLPERDHLGVGAAVLRMVPLADEYQTEWL